MIGRTDPAIGDTEASAQPDLTRRLGRSKRWIVLAHVTALALAVLAQALSSDKPSTTYQQVSNGSTYARVTIDTTTALTQTGVATLGSVSAVQALVSRVSVSDNCVLIATIVGSRSGSRASTARRDCRTVAPGWTDLHFSQPIASSGEPFILSLSLESDPGASITFVRESWDQYPGGVLVADGVALPSDLRFRVGYDLPALERWLTVLTYDKPGIFGSRVWVIAICCLAIVSLAAALRLLIDPNLPQPQSASRINAHSLGVLTVALLSVSAVWMTSTPPLFVPDEFAHLHDGRYFYLRELGAQNDGTDLVVGAELKDLLLARRWHVTAGIPAVEAPPTVWWEDGFLSSSGPGRWTSPHSYYILVAKTTRLVLGDYGSLIDQLYVARALSSLLGLLSGVLAYAAVRALVPGRPSVAAATALVGALIPQRSFMLSGVTNDSIATLAGSVALLAMCLAFTNRRLLSACVGVAALAVIAASKNTALFTTPFALLAIVAPVVMSVRDAARTRRALVVSLAAGILVLMTVGAAGALAFAAVSDGTAQPPATGLAASVVASFTRVWRNLAQTASVVPTQILSGAIGADAIAKYGQVALESYWGIFGWMNLRAPDWIYAAGALLTLSGVAAALVAAFAPRVTQAHSVAGKYVPLVCVGAFALALTLLIAMSLAVSSPQQGRYALPVTGFHALFVVVAPALVLPERFGRWWPLAATAATLATNIASLLWCASVWYSR